MSWANIPNNKIVSFSDLQISGIPLKFNQSHVSSTKMVTKDELITKYNVKVANLIGLSGNQLVKRFLIELGAFSCGNVIQEQYELGDFIGTENISLIVSDSYNVYRKILYFTLSPGTQWYPTLNLDSAPIDNYVDAAVFKEIRVLQNNVLKYTTGNIEITNGQYTVNKSRNPGIQIIPNVNVTVELLIKITPGKSITTGTRNFRVIGYCPSAIEYYYGYNFISGKEASWSRSILCQGSIHILTNNNPNNILVGQVAYPNNGVGWYSYGNRSYEVSYIQPTSNPYSDPYYMVTAIEAYSTNEIVSIKTARYRTISGSPTVDITGVAYSDIPELTSGTLVERLVAVKGWLGWTLGSIIYNGAYDGIPGCIDNLDPLGTNNYLITDDEILYEIDNLGVIVNIISPTGNSGWVPSGTYLYSSCESNNLNGVFTTHNYYADGSGGEYSTDTGVSC